METEEKTIYVIEADGEKVAVGSLAAIYDHFTEYQVGISLQALWAYKVTQDHPYVTPQTKVEQLKFIRKKQHRKK